MCQCMTCEACQKSEVILHLYGESAALERMNQRRSRLHIDISGHNILQWLMQIVSGWRSVSSFTHKTTFEVTTQHMLYQVEPMMLTTQEAHHASSRVEEPVHSFLVAARQTQFLNLIKSCWVAHESDLDHLLLLFKCLTMPTLVYKHITWFFSHTLSFLLHFCPLGVLVGDCEIRGQQERSWSLWSQHTEKGKQ